MTVPEIHDAITLALRNLGTNVFGVLDSYVLDIHLNTVADSIRDEHYNNIINTQTLTEEAQASVRNSYSILSRFINQISIDNIISIYDNYKPVIEIPFDKLDDANLYNGVEYVVTGISGTPSDYTKYGGKIFTKVGEKFSCDLKEIPLSDIVSGYTYKIKSIGSFEDYTSIGAEEGYGVGTIFTATSTITTGSDANDVLIPLIVPKPVGNTLIKPISDINYDKYISSTVFLKYKHNITKGNLPRGLYIQDAEYTITGTDHNIFEVTTPIAVPENGCFALKEYPVRLKTNDISQRSFSKYGVNSNSPICTLVDSKPILKIQPSIPYRVNLTYLRKRIPFDYYSPYVVDYDELLLPNLIKKTSAFIAGINNNPNYQQSKNEI